jgi:hypothetical protein
MGNSDSLTEPVKFRLLISTSCPDIVGTSVLTTGSATPFQVTRLLTGSLPLQPAGLLGSPNEPLSENSMPQVTLHTSLKLCGELPNSHSRTLTDKPYIIHGIGSGLYFYFNGLAMKHIMHI